MISVRDIESRWVLILSNHSGGILMPYTYQSVVPLVVNKHI